MKALGIGTIVVAALIFVCSVFNLFYVRPAQQTLLICISCLFGLIGLALVAVDIHAKARGRGRNERNQ